jgi:predicted nicotinamide N-methyase
MELPLTIQTIRGADYQVELLIPDAQAVQQNYYQQKQLQPDIPFPHWTKLWHSALALSNFLQSHTALIRNKTVLELAAGLGLPSLLASRYAAHVCCSDYLPEAVDVITRSATHNGLANMETRLLDWYQLPENLYAEVILLSDINYEPAAFAQLYQVLKGFIEAGATIILSTPQRLMAKPFIERLLPWQQQHVALEINNPPQPEIISVFVFSGKF